MSFAPLSNPGSVLVSVVIPAYEAAGLLCETLDSVAAQTHRAIEIVVVDDGSRDDSAAVAERWGASREVALRVVRQGNAGQGAARNAGVEVAQGALVAFLDSDDLWRPDFLTATVAALAAAPPETALAYTLSVRLDSAGRHRIPALAPGPGPEGDVLLALLRRNFLGNGSAALVRREAFLEVGGFDADRAIRGVEDWDLALRLAERWPFACVPRRLVGYRRHDATTSSNFRRMHDLHRLILTRHTERLVAANRLSRGEARGIGREALAGVTLHLGQEAALASRPAIAMSMLARSITVAPRTLLEPEVARAVARIVRSSAPVRRARPPSARMSFIASPRPGIAPPATFSVIMPAYRTEAYIDEAIRSVLGQTRSDWELIVVDDGSPDAVSERVEAYLSDPRIRLVRQPNAGLGAARTTATAASSAPYVCLLDSDDQMLPEYLESVGAVLDARPTVGLVSCDAHVLVETTGLIRRATYLDGPGVDPPGRRDSRHHLERLMHHNFLYPGATIRRSVLESVGGFDPERGIAEDWHLWVRIAASGATTEVIERPLAVYRKRAGSLSRADGTRDTFDAGRLRTTLRVLDEVDLPPSAREVGVRRAARLRASVTLDEARRQFVQGDRGAAATARSAARLAPAPRTVAIAVALTAAPRALRRLHGAKATLRRSLGGR